MVWTIPASAADCGTFTFPANVPVPDNSRNGLARTAMVSTPVGSITDLNVTLRLTNGWNGDLYAYLVHGSGYAVLLNRAGRTASAPWGYGDSGMNAVFDDQASNGDVHVYRMTLFNDPNVALGGPLTNAWAPDGRAVSPLDVTSNDSRTALLTSFNGLNPNGEWLLFVADLSSGDIATLQSWTLEICGDLGVAPSITLQPVAQTIECASSATLTSAASGTAPISYQWWHGGNAISGATGLTLSLADVHAADGGQYWMVASNAFGVVTSSVAVLTILDTTRPVVSCPPATTITVDGSCHAAVPNVLGGVSVMDTCDPTPALAQSPAAGTVVGPGTHTITVTATDASGNAEICTTQLTVRDTTPPTITLCPPNKTVEACGAGGAANLGTPVASDNCGTPSTTSDAPSVFPLGTTVVTWTVTDTSGNTATCQQTVTGVDTTAPAVTCPASTTISVAANCQAVVPNVLGGVTATDACDASVSLAQSPVAGTAVGVGTYTITVTATDDAGKTATCTTTLTVRDTTPPTITLCPPNVTVEACGAGGAVSLGTPVATDNCAIATVTNDAPTVFPLGPTVVTWTAVDTSGNVVTCQQTVTGVDTTAPTVTCPGSMTVSVAANCQATVPNVLANVTASDACDATVTISQSPTAGTAVALGTHTIVVTATDDAGKSATCSVSLAVVDPNVPVIVTQPQSRMNNVGTQASFSVQATSCSTLSFQWYHGTTAIPGATSSTYTIASVQWSDAGDYHVVVSNMAGGVSSATAVLTVNRLPVGVDNAAATMQDEVALIPITKLLGNDTDPDGDTLTLVSVSATSTNGGSALIEGDQVKYTPVAQFVGVDRFSYTISDGRGGSATAAVVVFVNGAGASSNVVSIAQTPSGYLVRCAGIPGLHYDLQRASNTSGPWTTVVTLLAPPNGLMDYEDKSGPPGAGFYRTLAQ